jgi:hypothetical protein
MSCDAITSNSNREKSIRVLGHTCDFDKSAIIVKQKVAEEARDWFFKRSREPFSLEGICEILIGTLV